MCATVREVRNSDHDSILEISRHIWEGHDYLPFVIDEWLADSSCHVYGVEMDNKLVAIANLRIIENEQIGWMEGLRVHPDYRGKGFADMLTKRVLRLGEELKVRGFRYTTSTENEISLKMAEKYGFAKILEMGVFWHPLLKNSNTEDDYPVVKELPPEEFHTSLLDNPSLVPNKILIHDWKALTLDSSLENLKLMSKSHRFYVAQDKTTSSLSYACTRRRSDRSTWIFTIYAEEQRGFLAHLRHNNTTAAESNCERLSCTYQPEFELILEEMGILSDEQGNGTHLVLLEKTI